MYVTNGLQVVRGRCKREECNTLMDLLISHAARPKVSLARPLRRDRGREGGREGERETERDGDPSAETRNPKAET